MKVMRILLILALLLIAAPATTPASAEPAAPIPPLCSVVRVQNKGTVAADPVTLNFYRIGDNDGVAEYSYTDPSPINHAVGRSYDISSATFSLLPSGSYAVVITSNQPLSSVVFQSTCSGGSPKISGAHSGFEQKDVGTLLYLPHVMSRMFADEWSSFIAIQNAGSTTATNVKIEFIKRNQSAVTDSFTNNNLKPGETWYINLKEGTYATAALNDFAGMARITSDVPVAAIINNIPDNSSRIQSYQATSILSQKIYATQIDKFYAPEVYTGGFTIVNPNSTSTPIVARFIRKGSDPTPSCVINKTLTAYQTWTVWVGNVGSGLPVPCTTGDLVAPWQGYLEVEVSSGTNKILGVFNMDSSAGQAGSGIMLPVESAATTLFFPLMVRNLNNFQAGYSLFNPSSNTLTLQLQWIKDDGTTTLTESKTLLPKQNINIYVGNKTELGNNWSGALKISITAGTGTIMGHANIVSVSGTPSVDVETYSLYQPFGP